MWVGRLKRILPLILISITVTTFWGAVEIFRNVVYYPSVAISAPGGVNVNFLFNGREDQSYCQQLLTNVANSMLSVCPTCQIKQKVCAETLGAEQQKLLSAEPLDVASVRMPDGGVITYNSGDPAIALAACQTTAQQTASTLKTGRADCYAPNTARPLSLLQQKSLGSLDSLLGMLFVCLGALAFVCALYLINRHEDFHTYLRSLPRRIKRLIMVGLDIVLLPAALLSALSIRYGIHWSQIENLERMLVVALVVAIPVFIKLGLYRSIIRYLDIRMVLTVVVSVTIAVLLLVGVLNLMGSSSLTMGDAVIYWLLALLYVGGSRALAHAYLRQSAHLVENRERVIIYGAGDAGAQLAASLKGNSGLLPVAFVDDNPDLAGSVLYGSRVYSAQRLSELVQELDIRQILLAMPSASKMHKKSIFDRMEPLGVRMRTIPSLAALIAGRAKISDIEDIGIEDLVGRDPVPPIPGLLPMTIEGKVVLVTGAGGSIGSELCRQILALTPKKLILFELSEYALYEISEELIGLREKSACDSEIIPVLGSVLQVGLLRRNLAEHRVNTIYHAAAYKHVPLVEGNPVAGIRNNVIGTLRAAEAAIAENVETFVLISTDKAVRPANIMGASKRMAELVAQGIDGGQTRFCMVRFGNVLDSSGSVVPLFRKQIQAGGPVTVTDPEVTRFFMTIPEAAQLVLQAGAMAHGGDVFVLNMGSPVKILDLARRMILLSGRRIRDKEHPEGDIEIRFTGLRPGEKLYEELLLGNNVSGTEHPLIMRAMEESMPWSKLKPLLSAIDGACRELDEEKAILSLTSIVPLFSQNKSAEVKGFEMDHYQLPSLRIVH